MIFRWKRLALKNLKTGLMLGDSPEGPVSKSSYFLGDPPPDPRFLASLGTLSPVELDPCSEVDL
jgi:hypothetical protein